MAFRVWRAKATISPQRVTPSLGQISNTATVNSFDTKGKMFTETLITCPRQYGNAALIFILQNGILSKDPTAGSKTSVKCL